VIWFLLFTGFGKPLSKPLSCEERGFEFSPFRAKKSEATSGLPHGTKSEASFGLPLLKGDGRGIIRATGGGSKRGERGG